MGWGWGWGWGRGWGGWVGMALSLRLLVGSICDQQCGHSGQNCGSEFGAVTGGPEGHVDCLMIPAWAEHGWSVTGACSERRRSGARS